MAHDNAESYHPVPSIRRARAKNPIGGSAGGDKTNLTDEHGPVVETKVTKHDDGTAHVTAKHSKGHEEIHQHQNHQAAQEHANTLMSGGDAMNSEGKVEDGSQQGEECPSCGATMQDGKCPQCGYESKPAGGSGQDADEDY